MLERWLIPIVVGVVVVLLGVGGVMWGRLEERRYYESLTTRSDLREFYEHWPRRAEPGATKVGGWLAIVIGVILVVVGIVLQFTT